MASRAQYKTIRCSPLLTKSQKPISLRGKSAKLATVYHEHELPVYLLPGSGT